MNKDKIITICSSAAFYKNVWQIAQRLKELGLHCLMPETAEKMHQSGKFDVATYKTWYSDPSQYFEKERLMKTHFDKIARGDAILVVNKEKRGVQGYIGANVLMEMGLAFYLGKKIFLTDEVSPDSPYYEEVMGMKAIVVDEDLKSIKL